MPRVMLLPGARGAIGRAATTTTRAPARSGARTAIVPTPTVPPRSAPTTTTLASSSVRTTPIRRPLRSASTSISESRGPGAERRAEVERRADRHELDPGEEDERYASRGSVSASSWTAGTCTRISMKSADQDRVRDGAGADPRAERAPRSTSTTTPTAMFAVAVGERRVLARAPGGARPRETAEPRLEQRDDPGGAEEEPEHEAGVASAEAAAKRGRRAHAYRSYLRGALNQLTRLSRAWIAGAVGFAPAGEKMRTDAPFGARHGDAEEAPRAGPARAAREGPAAAVRTWTRIGLRARPGAHLAPEDEPAAAPPRLGDRQREGARRDLRRPGDARRARSGSAPTPARP